MGLHHDISAMVKAPWCCEGLDIFSCIRHQHVPAQGYLPARKDQAQMQTMPDLLGFGAVLDPNRAQENRRQPQLGISDLSSPDLDPQADKCKREHVLLAKIEVSTSSLSPTERWLAEECGDGPFNMLQEALDTKFMSLEHAKNFDIWSLEVSSSRDGTFGSTDGSDGSGDE